jgi:hypothetical protein
MSKEEIVSAIQNCARKLGRVPTRRELQKMNGVSPREVDRRFGSYGRAVTLAGLEPDRTQQYGIGREALLTDWARVARKLGKAPTRFEYIAEGAYSTTPFERHWKRWGQVQADFVKFAKEAGQEGRWEEEVGIAEESPRSPSSRVIAAIENRISPQIFADETDQAIAEIAKIAGIAGIEEQTSPLINAGSADQNGARDGVAGLKACSTQQSLAAESGGWWRKRRVLRDRPVYGAPAVQAGALGHLPINEAGVLVLFGMMAERLGLVVLRVQTEFPDCEVLCEMEPGRWQRLRVEFEFESRNFLRHGHDPNGCDMIVCWRHNWAECPEGIEVVELAGIAGIAEIARDRRN